MTDLADYMRWNLDAQKTKAEIRTADIQNALRLLCRVTRRDEEMVFVGNDMILFREHQR